MITFIFFPTVSLSRHCHPWSCVHTVNEAILHTLGGWHSQFLFCCFSLNCVDSCLPVTYSHWVSTQFALRAKAPQLRLPFAPFSVKALCWYWLNLFVSCQHFLQLVVSWEKTAIENKEGKWWLNPEYGKFKLRVILPSIQSEKHLTSLPRPDDWNRVIIWHNMVSASLAIFFHYAQLATSTAAPSLPAVAFGLKGSWEAWPVCLLPGCKSEGQPIEPHL